MEKQVLKIREIGDPVLSKVCTEVDISKKTSKLRFVIQNLKDTFEYVGGFGIAAPQIGYDVRVIIIGVDKSKCRYKGSEDIKTTVLINPNITKYSEEKVLEHEGCHSVPSVVGEVERSTSIEVEYYDEKLQKKTWIANDYTARLIQHEYDHLNGICFLQRVKDNATIVTKENMTKFMIKD